MKRFILVALVTAMSAATVYSQPSEKGDAKKYVRIDILGKKVLVDGDGSFIHRSSEGYIVKGTYDVSSKKVLTVMYYNADGKAIDGKMTICTDLVRTTGETPNVPYANAYTGEYKKVYKTYYDPASSTNDYIDICGSYGEIDQYTLVSGILEGPYSYRYKVHGGNVDRLETIKGSYSNNQKDGEWVQKVEMDCAGTLDTWFEWINGSERTITKTTYADGKIVVGPTTYEDQ
jgi:hypothetical protein